MEAEWAITNLHYFLEKDGYQNVVRRVDFKRTHVDRSSGVYAVLEGFTLPAIDNLSNFTEYQNLTEEQVIEWVKEQQIEQDLLDEINRTVDLEAVATGIPWS